MVFLKVPGYLLNVLQGATHGVVMVTILFPKWEFLKISSLLCTKYFMKRTLRLSSFLLLFSAFAFITSCEEETLLNPDLVISRELELSGGQEVPAVTTTGNGILNARYDKSTKELNLTFAWGNLADTITAMHVHGPAVFGVPGPVLVPFTNFTRSRYGSHTQTFIVDEVTLREAELLNGEYYINIHTRRHPGGELRGQILFEGK
jgi:hypothetical protein